MPDNSIALLQSILRQLQSMSGDSKKNRTAEEIRQTTQLNQGGLNQENIVPKTEKLNISGVQGMNDVATSVSNIPAAVKKVGWLSLIVMERFRYNLKNISESMLVYMETVNKADTEKAIKSTEGLFGVMKAVGTLVPTIEVMNKLKVSDIKSYNEKLNLILVGTVSNINALNKVNTVSNANRIKAVVGLIQSMSVLPNAIRSMGRINFMHIWRFKRGMRRTLRAIFDITYDIERLNTRKGRKMQFDSISNLLYGMSKLPDGVKRAARINLIEIALFKRKIRRIIGAINSAVSDSSKLMPSDSKKIDNLIKLMNNLDRIPMNVRNISRLGPLKLLLYRNALKSIIKTTCDNVKNIHITKTEIENTEKLSKIIDNFSHVSKKASLAALLGIPAIIGVQFMKIIVSGTLKIIDKIAKDKNLKAADKNIENMNKAFMPIMKFMGLAMVLSFAVVGLGVLVTKHWKESLWGLVAFGAMVGSIVGLSFLTSFAGKKVQMEIKQMYSLMMFMGFAVVLSFTLVGLGALLKKNQPMTWAALGLTAATIITIGGLSLLAGWVGRNVKTERVQIYNLMIFSGFMMALSFAMVGLGMFLQGNVKSTFIALGITGLIIAGIGVISWLATKVGKKAEKGMKGIFLAGAVMAMSMVLTLAVIGLSKIIGSDFKKSMEKLGTTMLFITAILVGIVGISFLGNLTKKTNQKGLKSLLLAGAVLLVSVIVAGGVIFLSKYIAESKITFGNVAAVFGIMIGTVVMSGGLAYAAQKVEKDILGGMPVLWRIVGLTAVMTLVTFGVVKTAEAAKKVGWEYLLVTVGMMTTMMIGFGALAAALGALTPAAGLILAGVGVLATVGLLVGTIVGVTLLVIKMNKKIEESGKTAEQLGAGIKSIMTHIFSYDTLNPSLTGAQIISLDKQFIAMIPVFNGIRRMINLVSDMAIKLGGMVEEGASETTIRPYLGMSGDKPIYGDQVDVSKVTTTIMKCITTFINGMDTLFNDEEDIIGPDGKPIAKKKHISGSDRRGMRRGMRTLKAMIDPVNAFIDMVTGFNADEAGNLSKVVIDKDGKLVPMPSVNVSNVASAIGGSINLFIGSLNKCFDDISKKDRRRMRRGIDSIAEMIEPINKFIDMLMGFKNGNGTNILKKAYFDKEGNIQYGDDINVVEVATSIVNVIRTFCDELYGEKSTKVWRKMMGVGTEENDTRTKRQKRKDAKYATKAMGIFADVLEPVSVFMSTLTMFKEGNKDELIPIIFDKDGNPKPGETINVVTVASTIANAVTTFVSTLYDDKYKSAWKNMAKYGDSADVLNDVLTPISSFTDTLSKFKSEGDILSVPVFDKNGKIIDYRQVNFTKVAEGIANGVSAFIRTLFVDNIDAWRNMMGIDADGKSLNYNQDQLKSACGILGQIIDPVIKFADLMARFTVSGDVLIVGEGDKAKKIDFNGITDVLQKQINNYVTKISTAFDENTIKDAKSKFESFESFVSGSEKSLKIYEKYGSKSVEITAGIDIFSKGYDHLIVTITKFSNLTTTVDNAKAAQGTIDSFIQSLLLIADKEKMEPIDNLSKTISGTSTAIENFDKILSKEKSTRKQNLEELGKTVDELDKKFTKINETIKDMTGMFKEIGEADLDNLNKINEKVKEPEPQPKQPQPPFVYGQQGQQAPGISADMIAEAIRLVLNGMRINSEASVTSSDTESILNAIATKSYNITI